MENNKAEEKPITASWDDVFSNPKYKKYISNHINAFNMRPLPGKGLKYKRVGEDELIEKGLFNFQGIHSSFVAIIQGESNLSRRLRDCINIICGNAVKVALADIQNKKEKENGKEVETGNKDTDSE